MDGDVRSGGVDQQQAPGWARLGGLQVLESAAFRSAPERRRPPSTCPREALIYSLPTALATLPV